jgi:hypothetical protein
MDPFVSAVSSSSVVHYFDTDRHAILCGVSGFPDRSSKHERSVTCPSCVERLEHVRAARLRPAEHGTVG